MMDSFQQRKKDILSKIDKSSIGKWDKQIINFCKKINSKENYYTTSSCSGRIILMIDQEKKGENLFLFVSHDKIKFEDLKKELDKIISLSNSHLTRDFAQNSLPTRAFTHCNQKSLTFRENSRPPKEEKNLYSQTPQDIKNKNIKFKMEPAIIHIACKTLEDAEKLFEIGKNAGWKRLGIVGTRNGFTFELNSTEKLEFPIIQNKKILVDDNFLKIVVEDVNRKLEIGWGKIGKLERLM